MSCKCGNNRFYTSSCVYRKTHAHHVRGSPAKGVGERTEMATSKLNGVNYEVNGQTITFFDAKGTKLGGDRWAINALGGSLFVEVSPYSMMSAIRDCINGDVENGNVDELSMLLLAPRSAVVFYLEGQLTRQHLTKATEGPDYIDIPNVDIDGRSLTVRILKEPQYNVATADSEGNVL